VNKRLMRLTSTDWKNASPVAVPAARKISGKNENSGVMPLICCKPGQHDAQQGGAGRQ
jgi:hypothetical protein